MKKIFKSPFFSYEEIAQLGEGGGGIVWKVKRENTNHNYALKLIKESGQGKLSRFINEFAFLLQSNHPNIIRPVDSGKYEAQLFYVMPLAEKTLTPLLGKIPADQCCDIAVELLDGLAYLHSRGVIHRDLKPENILMIDGRPVICDLGIAHLLPENQVSPVMTGKGERMANFRYAAPEQRSNDPRPLPTMDIYSLGVIIHELFTGEFIQGGKSTTIASVYPEYGYWDAIINKCVENVPEKRFSSAAELKEQFALYKWHIECPIRDLRSEASHFYYDRFSKAFPEGENWRQFDKKEDILARLEVLLRPPYKIGNYDCVWWSSGDEDGPVYDVRVDKEKKLAYIGYLECDIEKIVSLGLSDYKSCVYVEVKPLKPLFFTSEEIAKYDPKTEAFAIYDGDLIPMPSAENGCYWENNVLKELDRDKILRYSRFLKRSNFLLLSRQNSVIQCADKNDVATLLHDILERRKRIEDLYYFIQTLQKPQFY